MAINIDGKTYRNLMEQVDKNQKDIEEFKRIGIVGIRIVGQVNNESELPEPTEYTGSYGDAYMIGVEAPYELYVYTRPNDAIPTTHWFNIGYFPLPGPQGVQGVQGPAGPQGRASTWYAANGVMDLPTPANPGDMGITNSGNIYRYLENYGWTYEFNTKGIQGEPGVRGPKGEQGEQGPQGPKGEQGEPGQSWQIIGSLSNEGQLPTASAEYLKYGYLVLAGEEYDLYVCVGNASEGYQWVNTGKLIDLQNYASKEYVDTTAATAESNAKAYTDSKAASLEHKVFLTSIDEPSWDAELANWVIQVPASNISTAVEYVIRPGSRVMSPSGKVYEVITNLGIVHDNNYQLIVADGEAPIQSTPPTPLTELQISGSQYKLHIPTGSSSQIYLEANNKVSKESSNTTYSLPANLREENNSKIRALIFMAENPAVTTNSSASSFTTMTSREMFAIPYPIPYDICYEYKRPVYSYKWPNVTNYGNVIIQVRISNRTSLNTNQAISVQYKLNSYPECSASAGIDYSTIESKIAYCYLKFIGIIYEE